MLSFKQFFLRRSIRGKNGWLEALARYIRGDRNFPDRGYYVMQDYLNNNGADDELLDAFEYAYNGPYTKYLRNSKRIEAGELIRHDVFELCGCCDDDESTREEFVRRPDLALLAVIAGGLFDIADAIRGKE